MYFFARETQAQIDMLNEFTNKQILNFNIKTGLDTNFPRFVIM